MTCHVKIQKIMVKEYVPKKDPTHPFIVAILYFLVFYLCDFVIEMCQ
jgi:hypothetical protein